MQWPYRQFIAPMRNETNKMKQNETNRKTWNGAVLEIFQRFLIIFARFQLFGNLGSSVFVLFIFSSIFNFFLIFVVHFWATFCYRNIWNCENFKIGQKLVKKLIKHSIFFAVFKITVQLSQNYQKVIQTLYEWHPFAVQLASKL